MAKIGIVTVFKTENCGSFLQAFALKVYCESKGYTPVFCDYRPIFSSQINRCLDVVKSVIKLNIPRAAGLMHRTFAYRRFLKEYDFCAEKSPKCDAYIFGSDTVWNFCEPFFAKRSGFFTGEGLFAPRYAYAVSAGNSKSSDFEKVSGICDNIASFDGISVRDQSTEILVRGIVGEREILRCPDPTLLFDSGVYSSIFAKGIPSSEKLLLIYYFGTIPEETMLALRAFAKEKGLKILRLGIPSRGDNETVVAEPKHFISAFRDAEYVFTNTFHGCVFSLLFHKKFATDEKKKKKVTDLLSHYDVSERIIDSADGLVAVYSKENDRKKIDEILECDREVAFGYLDGIIKKEQVKIEA